MRKLLLHLLLACLGQTVHGSEIIHGEKALTDSMQYMVSVQRKWGHVCGGFLVSEEFVVTAAHCGDGETLHHVLLGGHNLKEAKPIYIKDTCKFPLYETAGQGDDIMLVKLAEKVPLGDNVKTIPLPTHETNLMENQTCTVAGWGKTETHHYGVHELRVANVSVVDLESCHKKWNHQLPANVICAGGFGTKKGFCQGDSGGPLVCRGRAVGVVSFNKHANCEYPDVPNVYTDISRYLGWINNIIEKGRCVF